MLIERRLRRHAVTVVRLTVHSSLGTAVRTKALVAVAATILIHLADIVLVVRGLVVRVVIVEASMTMLLMHVVALLRLCTKLTTRSRVWSVVTAVLCLSIAGWCLLGL